MMRPTSWGTLAPSSSHNLHTMSDMPICWGPASSDATSTKRGSMDNTFKYVCFRNHSVSRRRLNPPRQQFFCSSLASLSFGRSLLHRNPRNSQTRWARVHTLRETENEKFPL
jgi:hypothetical protein